MDFVSTPAPTLSTEEPILVEPVTFHTIVPVLKASVGTLIAGRPHLALWFGLLGAASASVFVVPFAAAHLSSSPAHAEATLAVGAISAGLLCAMSCVNLYLVTRYGGLGKLHFAGHIPFFTIIADILAVQCLTDWGLGGVQLSFESNPTYFVWAMCVLSVFGLSALVDTAGLIDWMGSGGRLIARADGLRRVLRMDEATGRAVLQGGAPLPAAAYWDPSRRI